MNERHYLLAILGCVTTAAYCLGGLEEPPMVVAPRNAPAVAQTPFAPAQTDLPVQRVLEVPREVVVDPRIAELEQQVVRLQNEILAMRLATTPEKFLGACLNVPHVELATVLDRSSLARTQEELSELMRVLTPEQVWAVLKSEQHFHKQWSDLLGKGPKPDAPYSERKLYHDTVVTSWVNQNLPLFLSQLHGINVPTTAVERFRQRQLENL